MYRVQKSGIRWRIVGAVSRRFVPDRVAVTIGRTIFVYRDPLPDGVMDHEKIHVLQFEREGVRMAVRYVWYYVRGWIRFRDRREAYLRNPYEVEARAQGSLGRPGRADSARTAPSWPARRESGTV